MPPAGGTRPTGTRPLHPSHLFLSSPLLTPSAPPQAFRRGPGKGCRLSDRAQASFAFRPRGAQRSTPCPKLKAGKHYEAREGIPAALVRPATGRVSRQKNASGGRDSSHGDASPAPHSPLSFLTPSASPQAFRRGPGKGCRLSDRARHRLLSGRVADNALSPCPKLKAGKHYEAREGVPAALARPATERAHREKHASDWQGGASPSPITVFASQILLQPKNYVF